MTNILIKPYSDTDYADFAVLVNTNGQRTEQDDIAVYALYPYEKLQDGEIIDISQTPEYIALQNKKNIQQANDVYKKKIDNITNSALIDLLQKTAGEISQAIYDARTTAKSELYQAAKTEFYTATGLTPPTITQ